MENMFELFEKRPSIQVWAKSPLTASLEYSCLIQCEIRLVCQVDLQGAKVGSALASLGRIESMMLISQGVRGG